MIRLKILHLSDYVDLGGGETSFLNQLKIFDKKLLFPIIACPAEGKLTFELQKIGLKVETIPFRPIKRIGKIFVQYPITSTVKLHRLIQKENVQIVHANGFNSMAAAAPAAKLGSVPLVWTCHGWWPTGRLTGKFINYFADKVIAVSKFVKDKLEREGCVDPLLIEHIPLGVDISKDRIGNASGAIRREFNLNDDIPVVGMIGRFQEIKGHHIFVRMAAEICRSHPSVRFMIVGPSVFGNASESGYAQKTHELIHDSNLKENIILTGFRQDISDILTALDVLVVPSEIETFGMVILEAMAMGVPVVSCAKGGPEEIIDDGVNGFLIAEQDPLLLAQKVLYLLENHSVKEAIRLSGKRTVFRKFRIEDQVKKIESVYTQLAGLTS